MKTLSVKQPWASLICSGIKDIENRTWKTKFRGRVLIHAGATKTNEFWMHDSGVIKDYWRGVGSYVGIPDNEIPILMITMGKLDSSSSRVRGYRKPQNEYVKFK